MEKLISVILPVHEDHNYLSDAINSILFQTYKNIELIIVDDSRGDLVQKKIEGISDFRVKLVKGRKNGLSDALNLGIDISTGDYLARMDSDDICNSNRFEVQLSYMRKHNLDICGSNIQTFGRTNEKVRYPETDSAIKFALLFSCPIAHPTIMARARVFRTHRYNHKASSAEDYELWTKLALVGYKFGNCQEFLLRYRTHNFQSSKQNSDQLSRTIEIAKEYTFAIYHEKADRLMSLNCGFSESYKKEEVRELIDILSIECKKGHLNSGILSRIFISLYSRISDHSFASLRSFLKTMISAEVSLNRESKFKALALAIAIFVESSLSVRLIRILKST